MKTKILFLTPYPLASAPSQRFRFEQYFFVLPSSTISYSVRSFLTQEGWRMFYSKRQYLTVLFLLLGFVRRVFHVLAALRYHYVFIHRELAPLGPPVFEWIIAKVFRKKIIYDFDDAIWLEDPDEKGTLLSKLKWKSKVASICRWSYKVSVGNAYLAAFAQQYNPNVVLNPTTIDTETLHNPNRAVAYESSNNESSLPVIGWTGTHSTLQYLEPLIPVLQELEKKHSFTFMVICNKNPHYALRSFRFVPWHKETEIEDLMKMDIGVMPLTDDAWSRGKCGFKLLQYMALQKPALASPVGVNAEIITHGKNGYLCPTSEEWYQHLEELLLQPLQRHEMGIAGRRRMMDRYAVQSNQDNFLSLFL